MVPICRHPCDPMSQYIIDIQYSPRGNYPHISIPERAGGKVAMFMFTGSPFEIMQSAMVYFHLFSMFVVISGWVNAKGRKILHFFEVLATIWL